MSIRNQNVVSEIKLNVKFRLYSAAIYTVLDFGYEKYRQTMKKLMNIIQTRFNFSMKYIYQLFLAFNSTWLIVVVYLIKEKYKFNFLDNYSIYYSWSIFILTPILLTALSFVIAAKLPEDTLIDESIHEIELANNNFLPTYLGYFFVSLGVNDVSTLVVVFAMIYVFTYISQTLYFNPIFLIFGYHFYFIKTNKNIKIFLITRKKIKTPKEDEFLNLKRINNYTFIDL